MKIAREAREAAKHEVLIAGSIGPLGILQHVRELPHQDIVAIFKEQAGALEERGVDLFLLETFSDIDGAARRRRRHPLFFAPARRRAADLLR